MASKVHVCSRTDLTIPECSDCDNLNARMANLEEDLDECCSEVKDTLQTHASEIGALNSDVERLESRIESLTGLTVVEVDTLPATGEANTIYLVSNGTTYDMWMYVDNDWLQVGDTSIDLSDYLLKDDQYPLHSILITGTAAQPSYPGTWTLIDKEFTPYNEETSTEITWNTADNYLINTDSRIMRAGHTVKLRLGWHRAVAYSDDDEKKVCQFAIGAIGAAANPPVIRTTGWCDIGNQIVMVLTRQITAGSTIGVYIEDAVPHSTANDANIYTELVWVMTPSMMDSRFCNKFYWQRTA